MGDVERDAARARRLANEKWLLDKGFKFVGESESKADLVYFMEFAYRRESPGMNAYVSKADGRCRMFLVFIGREYGIKSIFESGVRDKADNAFRAASAEAALYDSVRLLFH